MEEAQSKNSEKHDETLMQISNLVTRIADMGTQFQGMATQLQVDRDLMAKQIQGLTEKCQTQAAIIQPLLQNQHNNNGKPSSSRTSTTPASNLSTNTDVQFGKVTPSPLTTENTSPLKFQNNHHLSTNTNTKVPNHQISNPPLPQNRPPNPL